MEIKVSDTSLFDALTINNVSVGVGSKNSAEKKSCETPIQQSTTDKLDKLTIKKGYDTSSPVKFDGQEQAIDVKDVKVGEIQAVLCDIKVDSNASLSVANSVLSAVKIPQAEPLKMAVNYFSIDPKKESLTKDIVKGDYESATKSSVNYAKSGWGTAVSAAKIADNVVNASVDLGLLSTNVATKVGTVTSSISKVSAKITLPLAIIGTGLSVLDVKKSQSALNKKSLEIKNLEKEGVKDLNEKMSPAEKARSMRYHVAKDEKKSLETNRNVNTVALALSSISTGALIASVTKPSTAKIAVPVSLATGLASSVTSVFADQNIRDISMHNLNVITQYATNKIKKQLAPKT